MASPAASRAASDAASTSTASAAVDGAIATIAATLEDLEWRDNPINPAWILEGTPRTRVAPHSDARDGWASTALWDCTRARFRWYFGWDETVVILEGSVRVTDAAGTTTTLRAGDMAYFPAGSWFTWEVDHYVRKVAFCRREVPLRIRRALALGELARRAPGAIARRMRRLVGRPALSAS